MSDVILPINSKELTSWDATMQAWNPDPRELVSSVRTWDTCRHCNRLISVNEPAIAAHNRHGDVVGLTHAGHCALQFKLKIDGASGFQGFLGC